MRDHHHVPSGLAVASALRARAERALDVTNILLSDVRYGLGAYLGVYLLTAHGWDEGRIGLALSLGGFAGLLAQAPMGALVDAVRAKRLLLACAAAVVLATCLVIPLTPWFWPVVLAGIIGAIAGSLFGPAIASISLGVVGRPDFPRRSGRNEAMFHAGNAACNVAVLVASLQLGPAVVFWVLGLTAAASIASVFAIPEQAIDHDLARGLRREGPAGERPSAWTALLGSRGLAVFALCGALFHMANASMLGLVGQKLSHLVPGQGITLTAACAIAAQTVMVPTAALAGAKANAWGRKPLLLAAFLALAARGALYTASDNPAWLIAVQLLDGVGAGLVGALFPVVVADLTRGTGHFAGAQGAVGAVHMVGGIVSATLAGQVVVRAGYDAAFLILSGIALVGAALFFGAMPETRDGRRPDSYRAGAG
jgi:predicted MFS family arabinose efflux permease